MKKIRFKLSTEKVSALIFFVFAILFPMYSTLYQVDNFSNFYITVLVSFSIVLTTKKSLSHREVRKTFLYD